MIKLIRLIWHIGVLNCLLFIVALFGILMSVTGVLCLRNVHFPTRDEISDSKKKAIPIETLTEEQMKEGAIVEGKIFLNLGEFPEVADNHNDSYSHYAIFIGDKVMSVAIDDFGGKESLLHEQALNYKYLFVKNGLNILQYDTQNKTKKSRKNNKAVKQLIQEHMKDEPGIALRGKIIKMDDIVKFNLREHVTPDGKDNPALQVLPYEIQYIEPIDWTEILITYAMVVGGGVLGIATLGILILRRRMYVKRYIL